MAYILSDSFKLLGIKTMGLFLSYPIRENKKHSQNLEHLIYFN